MIKQVMCILGFVCVFALGLFLGFRKSNEANLIMEIKILRLALERVPRASGDGDPFREFVLARYYRLLGRLDPKQGSELASDFGPVNAMKLKDVVIDKEPGSVEDDYTNVKKLLKRTD